MKVVRSEYEGKGEIFAGFNGGMAGILIELRERIGKPVGVVVIYEEIKIHFP